MKRSGLILLLSTVLAACGGSTPTSDAGVDAFADATSVRDVVIEAASEAAVDVPVDARPDVRTDVEPFCDIPGTYTYGLDGGFVPYQDRVTLAPGRSFTFTRMPFSSVDAGPCNCSCTTMIDHCGTSDGGVVDTLAVIVAFNDGDVMAAFADQTRTLYGRDTRPADGQVFVVTRGDGRRIEIGAECGGATGCREVRAGLARLRDVLTTLQTQQLMRPPCNALSV